MRHSFGEGTGADPRARDAAIAAMGQRLAAAAGPRTRRRVPQRAASADEKPIDVPPEPARGPVLVAHRTQAVIRDVAPVVPPGPRRRAFSAIGRATAIASMASAGFALVLLAQSPRWSAARPAAAPEVAKDQPTDVANPAIPPAILAASDASGPAPIMAPAPVTLPAANVAPASPPPPAARPISAPPKAEPSLPAPKPAAVPRPARPMQVQLASFARPRPPRPAQLAARHEASRVAAPRMAMAAHYTLPKWLTEARDTPPRPLIMSPPPHDLEAPPQVASRVATPPVQFASAPVERPRNVLPPIPRPRIVYASAYAAPPVAYRGAVPYAGYDGPAPPLPYGYPQGQPYAP